MKISGILLKNITFKYFYLGILLIILTACGGADEPASAPPAGGGDTTNKPIGSSACLQTFGSSVANDLSRPSVSAVKGGRIYDNVWTETGLLEPNPDENHPLWVLQSTNTRTGPDTWRCKECHGWDYKGIDGVYGSDSSSHYTGFPGILSAQNDQPIDVFCAIYSGTAIDARHDFSSLGYSNVLLLTKFITSTTGEGLIDTNLAIDPTTGSAMGDNISGKELFEGSQGCSAANCHGLDGAARADEDGHTVGSLAVEDPWEVLHKIRFGDPNTSMPAYADSTSTFYNFNLTQIADIIYYAQVVLGGSTTNPPPTGGGSTPPTAEELPMIVLGGRLFDSWFSEKQVAAPASDNPLWEIRDQSKSTVNNRTGEDTWRCKECHGWDYKGKDGIYGEGSDHYTGIRGIWNTTLSEQGVIDHLTNGFFVPQLPSGPAVAHNFGTLLTATEIQALAKFVKKGTVDTDLYIGQSGLIRRTNDDYLHGQSLFNTNFSTANGNCAVCHGADGRTLAPVILGEIAVTNPWEMLHKIRFGQPPFAVSQMPGLDEAGFTVDDAVDIVFYSQGLPQQ